MTKPYKPGSAVLRVWQLLLLVAILLAWHFFSHNPKIAFFFGEPLVVAQRIWAWFVTDADIYRHLWITLTETVLAFFIGTIAGLGVGLWLGLSRMASDILDPYITAANSMPRVILAPIFGMWFGLGIWSKVALAVTLVFFIVFFNIYQGVREVSPTLLDNARMLGADRRQLLRHVYLPSATSWVYSPTTAPTKARPTDVGYLILQAEGTLDVNTVFAGIVVLTAFALVLDYLVGLAENRLLKWRPKSGETEKI